MSVLSIDPDTYCLLAKRKADMTLAEGRRVTYPELIRRLLRDTKTDK